MNLKDIAGVSEVPVPRAELAARLLALIKGGPAAAAPPTPPPVGPYPFVLSTCVTLGMTGVLLYHRLLMLYCVCLAFAGAIPVADASSVVVEGLARVYGRFSRPKAPITE